MGSEYSIRVYENLANPFWKEMLRLWNEFCDMVNGETFWQTLDSPLWYNKNLIQGTNSFIKNWYGKRH